MASFFQTLSDVFSAFGAAVFVPVILFIIAKCMGVTGKKAAVCSRLDGLQPRYQQLFRDYRTGC